MFNLRSGMMFRYGLPLVCMVATLAVFLSVESIIRSRGEMSFATVTNDNLAALESRLDSYSQSLNGLVGFLDASDAVTALDWRHMVSALGIKDNLPGLTGLGYIRLVDARNTDDLKAEMRALGVDNLHIHPETGQDQKLIVTYFEPAEAYVLAAGLDIASEESQREIAMQSRDSGKSLITPPVKWSQGDHIKTGFLLLLPHYQRGMPLGTEAERRAAFSGWVFAWLDASRLFSELTDSQDELFHFRVTDPLAGPDQRVIHDHVTSADDNATGSFVRHVAFPVYGQTWDLEWQSTPVFDLMQNRYAKWLFLIAGFVISSLIYLYARSTHERHQMVTREVELKTREMTELIDQNRTILLNAMVGILVLDGEDRILQANPAAEHLFGHAERKLRTMRLQDIVDEAAAGPTVSPGLYKARSIDGKSLYLDVQRNLWMHKSEQRQTVLISDVTEKTLANQALAESERRWSLALMGAEIGVYDVDLTTNVSKVSDSWLRLMGIPLDDSDTDPQQTFLARVHPNDLQLLHSADADCISGRTPRAIAEYRVRFGDKWRWMHSDGTVAERDADGRPLRFIGAQTDVTELRQARDALARSEDRFRLVLSSAPVGTAVLDLDGRIIEANAAICDLTGYSAEMLIGLQIVRLFSSDEVENLLSKIADLNGETDKVYSGEHQIVRSDGTFRWGEIKVSCVVDINQGGEIYIIQINDITHKREVDRVKGEFVATVSHELRTPLTSIKGALDLVSRITQSQLDAPAKRLLEIAAGNTDRLIFLVNDILDMEKISAGTENFAYADVSCKHLIHQAELQIRPIAEKNNLTVVCQESITDALVRVDPDRAGQVLLNMLSNACKFSFSGGEVKLGFSINGTFARFTIVNQGEGVSEEFRSRVFDRFSQADSSDTRRKGGTGLGLSISKQIVERMGGEIGFDSVPGEPTAFWFTCPLVTPGFLPNPKPVTLGQAPRKVKRILHLQNDADFATMIHASLDNAATVVTVLDISAAREALGDGIYDVIIVDWNFADDQAKDLFDDISLRQPQARVVALSAGQPRDKDQLAREPENDGHDSMPEAISRIRAAMDSEPR